MCLTPVGSLSGYRYVAEVGPQISGFKWRTLNQEVRTEEMDFEKLPRCNQKKFILLLSLSKITSLYHFPALPPCIFFFFFFFFFF